MAKGGKRPGAGRPKGAVASHTLEAQELRKQLIQAAKENWEAIVFTLIDKAVAGDTIALRELLDRVLGKAAQPLTGLDDGPIQIEWLSKSPINQEDVVLQSLWQSCTGRKRA